MQVEDGVVSRTEAKQHKKERRARERERARVPLEIHHYLLYDVRYQYHQNITLYLISY